jgi:hypothetical protein
VVTLFPYTTLFRFPAYANLLSSQTIVAPHKAERRPRGIAASPPDR